MEKSVLRGALFLWGGCRGHAEARRNWETQRGKEGRREGGREGERERGREGEIGTTNGTKGTNGGLRMCGGEELDTGRRGGGRGKLVE